MYYLKNQTINEIVIQKSRFIGVITPINSLDEIPIILKQIKKHYPKANHYCTAYIFNDSQGSNDDGEPSGTAGVPILEILNHHNLNKVYAVIVRYFGGIKLGAGGLIRAYAKASKEALEKVTLLEERKLDYYKVTFNYDKLNEIDFLFKDYISNKEFSEFITYDLLINNGNQLVLNNQHLFNNFKFIGEKLVLVEKNIKT